MSVQSAEWISLVEAARRLGVASPTALRILQKAGVRQLSYPGARTRFHGDDVGGLIRSSITPAAEATSRREAVACA